MAGKEDLGCHLVTLHNLTHMKRLMTELRQAILDDTFPDFAANFLHKQFPDGKYPEWVEQVAIYTHV